MTTTDVSIIITTPLFLCKYKYEEINKSFLKSLCVFITDETKSGINFVRLEKSSQLVNVKQKLNVKCKGYYQTIIQKTMQGMIVGKLSLKIINKSILKKNSVDLYYHHQYISFQSSPTKNDFLQ